MNDATLRKLIRRWRAHAGRLDSAGRKKSEPKPMIQSGIYRLCASHLEETINHKRLPTTMGPIKTEYET